MKLFLIPIIKKKRICQLPVGFEIFDSLQRKAIENVQYSVFWKNVLWKKKFVF